MKKRLVVLMAILLALMIPMTAFAANLTFSTTTLDGKPYTSSKMSNYKLTMVNVWGEWCYWCVEEMPDLQKLYKKYDDLLILGLWYGNDKNEAIEIAKDAGVTYPLLEPDSNLQKLINKTEGFPTTFFFDMNGKPVGDKNGYEGAMSYESWKQIIEELLEQVANVEPENTDKPEEAEVPTAGGLKYKLNETKLTAEFIGPVKKTIKTIKIPATVVIGEKTYKVTSIAKEACKGLKKLTTLTIGKNVSKIGASAFKDCAKLSKITIQTTKLKASKVGANAFKNVKATVMVKCPSGKKAAYKKILLKKGLTKKAVFK